MERLSPPTTLDLQRGFRDFSPRLAASLVVCDAVSFIVVAYAVAGIVNHTNDPSKLTHFFFYSSYVFVVFWIALFFSLGLYRRSLALSIRDEFYYVVAALALGIAPQLLVFTIVPQLSSSRLVLLLAAFGAIVLVGGGRAIAHAVRSMSARLGPSRVLVIGRTGSVSREFDGRATSAGAAVASLTYADHASLHRSWCEEALRFHADLVVFNDWADWETMPQLVRAARAANVPIAFAYPAHAGRGYRFKLEQRGDRYLLTPTKLAVTTPVGRAAKRSFDIACALTILLLGTPIMLVAALAILAEDRGTIFFRQQRLGRDDVPFSIFKFRTMRTHQSQAWVTERDPRITFVGRFLRRTSIDELPQLFNVLRGEMSIVGPRPEMVEYARQFAEQIPRYQERHVVPPGITGWSQIHMKRLLTPDDARDVLQHDLFYIEHWNLIVDISVVCKTAMEFLFHAAS